jgi:ABC-type transport system involved in multi-copper enzyme maturation permease subunit
MRWGLGPVFIYECVANSRRWQTYAIRSFGVAALLVAMSTIASSYHPEFVGQSWRDYARLGGSYFYAIIGVELALVMLAAPAATAGAICLDRARGTLAHMMVTDLSDPEIVLGKLAARLLPVLGLVACSWPVLAISSLLGGIDPTALTLAFAVILAVALLGCTMAMALSVWARKPHEVVLVTYTAWMLALLIWPIWFALSMGKLVSPPPHWSLVADPYYLAFAPYSAPGQVDFWDYLGFFVVTLGASALLMVLAIWRMRPVANRGTDEHRQRPGLGLVARLTRWLPGPSLDGNPVLWREWHRSRPSRWLMILVVVIGGATGIACVSGAVSIWANGLDDFQRVPGPWTIVGVYGCFI